ncbi:DUF952 domain-containing protein [Nocardia sp. 2]|uniref:DUF952 domain-containing protein n=1 Tax=Nocardia acididurans TaxID=2802282 RepID=A0ABS1MGB2_9NOCA|nr:DUF952 domain-containing protein [Nocardia acididurans]MBL1079652.1 DUF952 domain-containing protein [Nocardia acididurans]
MQTDTTPNSLVHICSRAEWEAAQEAGEYRAASLEEVGFIHLSAPYQAHLPANRIFRGRSDLVLLRLDPGRLNSPVKWEPGVPTDPASMLFPHLYGPLPLTAVTEVTAYEPGADGEFAPLV